MEEVIKIKEGLYHVGTQNPGLRVFDIIMYTPHGTSYNSYLVVGKEKVALIETVKENYCDVMMNKIKEVLGDRKIDYLILNHTEPDHSGSTKMVLDAYPEAKFIGSANAIKYVKEMMNDDSLKNEFLDISKTKSIDLGGKTLEFFSAPNLHWPDSIFTYCKELKTLFPCDFLGSHYSFYQILDNKLTKEQEEKWFDAFKYYYAGIFGPFKSSVMDGLKIIDEIKDIDCACTSHGPVLTKDRLLPRCLEYYEESSKNFKNKFNENEVTIAYVSAYGYTGEMAEAIAKGVESTGLKVNLYDCVEADKEQVIKDIQSSRGILLGTCTILSDALPNIYELTLGHNLNPIIHMGKIAGSFGSYGWSGEGAINIDQRLQQLRFKLPLDPLRVNFRSSEKDIKKCFEYGVNFGRAVKGENINLRTKKSKKTKKTEVDTELEEIFKQESDGKEHTWKCVLCGHTEIGVEPSDYCTTCAAGGDIWEMVESEEVQGLEEGKVKYICEVCGYEVEGEHPDVCPVCGQDGDIWKKVEEKIESAQKYVCTVCGYEVEGEHPDVCPVCNASGDIWKPVGKVEEKSEKSIPEKYVCTVCGYEVEGEHPEVCPVCNASGDIWKPVGKVEEKAEKSVTEKYVCTVCGYEVEGEHPEVCPVCSATGDIWKQIGGAEKTTAVENDYSGKIVVVGGGVAGVSSCEAIRSVNKDCEIQLISNEEYPYFRPHVSKKEEVMELKDRNWYGDNNIQLINDQIMRVNADKTLSGDMGIYDFDKLILATGSTPLHIFGEYSNLSNIHTIGDSIAIKNAIETSNDIVIIGGGAIGVELSEYILTKKKDINVSIVDISPVLFKNYISDKEGCEFLMKHVRDAGVDLHLGSGVVDLVVKNDVVTGVELNNGTILNCDSVFMSISTKPNSQYPIIDDSFGIKHCDLNGGILVNERMSTGNPDIFSAGACTSTNGVGINNWEFSTHQGRTAGLNAIGIEDYFELDILGFSCQAFGVNVYNLDNKDVLNELNELNSISNFTENYFLKFYYDNEEKIQSIKSVSKKDALSPLVLSKCMNKNIFTILKGIKRFVK